MRNNQPVTQRERPFDSRQTLLSTTDPKGRITYANSAFVAISGFDAAELTGQPHNIVRHPDMPPEAFADMWATIKGGEAVAQLDQNTQSNAALVEEIAAAARSLHQQAERLGEAVAVWSGQR